MSETSESVENENMPTVAEASVEGRSCKECHWFLNVYRKKTCSEKHKADDKACKDFQVLQAKAETIKNDPFIVAINEEVTERISPNLCRNALNGLKGNEKEKISKAKFNFTKIKQNLDTMWRKAEAHIINTYPTFLSSLKDSNQRASVIKDILESITDLYEEIDILNSECDQIVNNVSSEDIKNDEFIASINNEVVNNMSKKLDRSLFDELKGYYVFSIKIKDREDRPVPAHYNTTGEWEILSNLNEQCQAYRDRVLDIQFSFTRIRQDIEKLQRQANAYILNNYSVFIANLKDSAQRTMIIEDIIEPLTTLHEEISELSKKCEQTTSNLNSTSYSLKEIKEIALKVHDMKTMYKRNV
jgi:hypothetical protein